MNCNMLMLKSVVTFALIFIPHILLADNRTSQESDDSNNLPVMPVVLVEADKITPTTGMVIIDKEMIEALPMRNGDVNEIISIVPGVQQSNSQFRTSSLQSFTAGEITPPVSSISGSRFYDNNFTIDGLSNNSLLDPATESFNLDYKLPTGHPQKLFLTPQLIEQVTVYNSNIPAEFGGFSGGQVDVETIAPSGETEVSIFYRTTNDSWTQLHIHEQDMDDFQDSSSADYQPDFEKHDYGFIVQKPLGEATSAIISYQAISSEIPLTHLDRDKNQYRKNENFLFKLNHETQNSTNLAMTVLYAPTSADYFLYDFKDSDYSIDGGGYLLSTSAQHQFQLGELDLHLGISGQSTKRKAPQERFLWGDTDSIDWPSTKEGGKGDLEISQRDIELSTSFQFEPLSTGPIEHIIKLGLDVKHSRYTYKRPETAYYYFFSNDNDGIAFDCDENDRACIDNEQYLESLNIYPEARINSTRDSYAAYIQDIITAGPVEVFPGLRATYDDLTNDLNLAPRLSTSWDILGNQQSVLFAGLNRYYSGTLQSYKIYSEASRQLWRRSSPGSDAWELISTTYYYSDNQTDAPYSDERNIGFIQRLFGGQLKLQYLEKKSRDELAKERTDEGSYILNNNGRSDHESAQVSWQRSWRNHYFEINSTWQKTVTSSLNYDSIYDDEDTQETIWYDGEEIYRYEIPAKDFNLPVVANIIYTGNLLTGLSWTNVMRYRGAYYYLKNSGQRMELPSSSPFIYEKKKAKSSITFDWHFNWKLPLKTGQDVILSLDVLNVFNKQIRIGYQTGTSGYDYEVGRQFWAGLEFNF